MTPIALVRVVGDVLRRHFEDSVAAPASPSALEMWDRFTANTRAWREEYPNELPPSVSGDLHAVLDIEDHR